eukprot:m.52582 g.52582  ORF g.52582 m.52582 type:complete len:188 (+) comp12716_c0_seq2:57-620(+)
MAERQDVVINMDPGTSDIVPSAPLEPPPVYFPAVDEAALYQLQQRFEASCQTPEKDYKLWCKHADELPTLTQQADAVQASLNTNVEAQPIMLVEKTRKQLEELTEKQFLFEASARRKQQQDQVFFALREDTLSLIAHAAKRVVELTAEARAVKDDAKQRQHQAEEGMLLDLLENHKLHLIISVDGAL